MAAIENVERLRRTRDIGAYLDLTERRYQSAETDVGMGISKHGDAAPPGRRRAGVSDPSSKLSAEIPS